MADGERTLLGDAIHHVPPVGGIGGNTALCDARDLCQVLREADSGDPVQLRAALAGYERQMLRRGFGAVSASRRYLTLATSHNPALRLTARGFFRLCGGTRCSPVGMPRPRSGRSAGAQVVERGGYPVRLDGHFG